MRFTKPLSAIQTMNDTKLHHVAKSVIESRHWSDVEITAHTLVLTPFVYLEFQAFHESEVVGKGKLVGGTIRKSAAFNTVTLQLEDDYRQLLKNAAQIETDSNVNFQILPASAQEKELSNLVRVYLAQKYSVPRENIILTQYKEAYLAVWEVRCKIGAKSIALYLRADNHQLMNPEQLPTREKGWAEITQEVISDLRNPATWLSYSAKLGKSALGVESPDQDAKKENTTNFAAKFTQLLSNLNVQLGVLAVVLLVLLYLAFTL